MITVRRPSRGAGRLLLGVALGAGVATACGSSGGSTFEEGSSSSGGSSGASGSSSGASSGLASSGSSGSGGASGSSGGSAEVCDGVDNDGDGIVDNVDVGNDGVCDCLRIATLGVKGAHGAGDVFATWLDARSVRGAVPLDGQALTPALLAQHQVIVAQDLSKIGRGYAPEEVAALADWVRKGGGLFTLIGYADANERANVNALLAPLGPQYLEAPILQKQGGSTVAVTAWTPHPVTANVVRVGVDNGYEVGGEGLVLATEQAKTLLRARELDQGHVLVWGDEWITYDSEWKEHPDYQVERFWLNALKWLTPAGNCQVPLPPPVR